MPTTMQLISAQTLTSTASTVTFSSIPQTFTDLKLVCSVRNSSNGSYYMGISFNTGGSYSIRYLLGSGSSANSYTSTDYKVSGLGQWNGSTTSTFGSAEFYIPNYTSSNQKSFSSDSVSENNSTTGYQDLSANLWDGTGAITTINVVPDSSTFAIGSSFYLYGISSDTTTQNTSGPYAFGGDTITTDGTYWYHTFLNSNSFTPQKNLTDVDYLVVAGGGGAGGDCSGGGGAGGLRCTVTATGGGGSLESKLSLTAGTVYAAVVGAGGAGNTGSGAGTNGGNSVFSTITSTGGGGGAGDTAAAVSGGSGGGGAQGGGSSTTGASGTANQGYKGGDATSGSQRNGGGGGAGAVGGNGTGSVSGAGGNGVATSISGSSVTYAGGGGGGASSGAGAGGSGGGGAGGNGSGAAGTAGSVNTGSGGGGGGTAGGDGASGGSGIIIVRYAV